MGHSRSLLQRFPMCLMPKTQCLDLGDAYTMLKRCNMKINMISGYDHFGGLLLHPAQRF
jgi:hypothetical protein